MLARVSLGQDYTIPRIIRGAWQLSRHHGQFELEQAKKSFALFAEAGFDTVDCADIYTGVEELIGHFASELALQVHTKFVPDLSQLQCIKKSYVERIVKRSLQRLKREQLDLVQFHWWDYAISGYLETAMQLVDLQKQGFIRHLGLTNFDTQHSAEFLEAGYPCLSTQVQYSLLDRRPRSYLVPFCQQTGVQLLCYGSLAGGFLHERWLHQPAPPELYNASQRKYRLIIDDFGGWEVFQELLQLLHNMAQDYQVSLSSLAIAWTLAQEQVAAVLVGARNAGYLHDLKEVLHLKLKLSDLEKIESFLAQHPGVQGRVFELERQQGGAHARIMRYNLNSDSGS